MPSKTPKTPPPRLDRIEARLASMEARINTLEKARPGRKAIPVVVSKVGVCGVEPGSDSTICPFASLYRHQKGCRGTACQEKATEYYRDYRAGKRQGNGG